MWFVPRRRHERELAAAKAEANQQRKRAEKAERIAKTEVAARRTITAQYCDLSDEHDQTVRRNTSLCAQLAELKDTAGLEAQARKAADRIARLQKAVARARTEAGAERRHTATLQTRLDGAVGLTPTQIQDSAPWQPGYVQPKPDKEVTAS